MAQVNNGIETLGLFIEKADRLRSSILVKSLIANKGVKLRLHGDMENKVFSINFSGPDVEQVDAFLFTMRMFIQERDDISFNKMEKMLDRLTVAEEARSRFKKQLEFFNNYLGKKSMISINEDNPSYKEIMETVLYGYRGHMNPDKYSRYKTWQADPIVTNIIDIEFTCILLEFSEALDVLANNCRIILKELTEGSQKST